MSYADNIARLQRLQEYTALCKENFQRSKVITIHYNGIVAPASSKCTPENNQRLIKFYKSLVWTEQFLKEEIERQQVQEANEAVDRELDRHNKQFLEIVDQIHQIVPRADWSIILAKPGASEASVFVENLRKVRQIDEPLEQSEQK